MAGLLKSTGLLSGKRKELIIHLEISLTINYMQPNLRTGLFMPTALIQK